MNPSLISRPRPVCVTCKAENGCEDRAQLSQRQRQAVVTSPPKPYPSPSTIAYSPRRHPSDKRSAKPLSEHPRHGKAHSSERCNISTSDRSSLNKQTLAQVSAISFPSPSVSVSVPGPGLAGVDVAVACRRAIDTHLRSSDNNCHGLVMSRRTPPSLHENQPMSRKSQSLRRPSRYQAQAQKNPISRPSILSEFN